MSHSEAVTPTACTCDCQEESKSESPVSGWQNCECLFCGPLLEDGSRKCQVLVSPILIVATAVQSGVPKTGTLPVFCGNCRDHCLFVRRCDAVIRARETRKQKILQRSRSRSRKRSGSNQWCWHSGECFSKNCWRNHLKGGPKQPLFFHRSMLSWVLVLWSALCCDRPVFLFRLMTDQCTMHKWKHPMWVCDIYICIYIYVYICRWVIQFGA